MDNSRAHSYNCIQLDSGGDGKAKAASLTRLAVGANCRVGCLGSPPRGLSSSSSLDQITYMPRALFHKSKKWKLIVLLLRPEPRIHTASLLPHSEFT